ncbi:hypothetical protein HaLaN_32546, partial [Haematococcus lacustris]
PEVHPVALHPLRSATAIRSHSVAQSVAIVPAMSKRHMHHHSAVDGGASATDGYSPAGEAPPPATRLLDLPPALLDDIACHAFSLAHLLHVPALRVQLGRQCCDQLGRQCCDQLLTPRVVAALQARTRKLALTLWQPETEDSVCYSKQLAPTLQLPQTEYSKHFTNLLAYALAKLDNCAAVEGLCVSSDALASLLSHPLLALHLQQLHVTNDSVPVGDEHRLLGPVFQ